MTAYGARAGPAGTIWRCLLIGEDRKWPVGGQNGAFDPERTSLVLQAFVVKSRCRKHCAAEWSRRRHDK